jgi:hypothetical protein
MIDQDFFINEILKDALRVRAYRRLKEMILSGTRELPELPGKYQELSSDQKELFDQVLGLAITETIWDFLVMLDQGIGPLRREHRQLLKLRY